MIKTGSETSRTPYGYAATTPVYFDDLDPMGILHNARYAVLVERAITTWWQERGVSYAGGRPTTPDAFSVVRDFSITYLSPVRGTGEITVHFWIERIGDTSVDYRFRLISSGGESVFAEGRRLSVRLDPATMKPATWTDRGRELAAALIKP